MADGMALPRVITTELLYCEHTHAEPAGGVLVADTTGSAVAQVGTRCWGGREPRASAFMRILGCLEKRSG